MAISKSHISSCKLLFVALRVQSLCLQARKKLHRAPLKRTKHETYTVPFPNTLFIVTKFDLLDSMHSPVTTPHSDSATYE